MKYHERKPDMETESFRAWSPKDKEEEKEVKDIKGYKIKYKDMEFNLCGFNIIKHNKSGGIFAYKFKHEERQVIYYCEKEDNKDFIEIVNTFKSLFRDTPLNYVLTDMKETLENVYQQQNSLEKLGDKKK